MEATGRIVQLECDVEVVVELAARGDQHNLEGNHRFVDPHDVGDPHLN
jgi:hypothetical protein